MSAPATPVDTAPRGGLSVIWVCLASSALTALVLVVVPRFLYPPAPPVLGMANMPKVKLVDDPKSPERPYRGTYEFSQDWFTFHIPVWEKAMAPYKGKPGVRYLEVGLFEGGSSLWMLENTLTDPASSIVGLDVFEGPEKDRFFKNLKASGEEKKVQVIIGPSQVELRKLPVESFDIVYVDGSHLSDDVLEDCVLCWRLVKVGGLLILDDYLWPKEWPEETKPKAAIDTFLRFFGRNFQVIHVDYQVILVKKPRDATFKPW